MRMRTPPAGGEVGGPARVDRRTKNLLTRLRPGEVAIVDHVDLDRIAAEGLVEARPAAVVNAARSISGRYPNVGPLLLAAAGIPLLDDVGPDVIDAVVEGQFAWLDGDQLLVDGQCVAKGTRHDLRSLEQELEAARAAMGDSLSKFAENTLTYLQGEGHLLTDTFPVPDIGVPMKGRHVLVVVRGIDYRQDLAALGAYIRELGPVLIGVDGGADALLEQGHKPDVIVGDFDSVSTRALQSGARLVVHAYAGGRAPGAERLEQLGLPFVTLAAPGTSEDIAMLMAFENGAELIVAVGTHASAVEFLEKGRAGMASTFLVRLKVGPILVDAKGVSRLYEARVRKRDMVFLVASALLTMLVVIAISTPLHAFIRSVWTLLTE